RTVTNSIVLQIARAYTPAPIARHQRSSTQLTSLLINNAGALWVDRTEGVKAFARGFLSDAEGVTAQAEGVFIKPAWAREVP
nr:hypothetical protein [Mycobacterium pseudoshottsii]